MCIFTIYAHICFLLHLPSWQMKAGVLLNLLCSFVTLFAMETWLTDYFELDTVPWKEGVANATFIEALSPTTPPPTT